MRSHNGKVDDDRTNSRRVYNMSLLSHIGAYCACTHAYMPVFTNHDASEQRDAAEQIAADRLPVFQRKNTDRIWWSCYVVLD